MKKLALLLIGIVVFSSCLNDDKPNYTYEFVAIDEAKTPESFTFGKRDTITLKYTFKNSCYNFDNVYYEYQDTTRIVAIRALVNLDDACTEAIVEKEHKFIVTATQREDYLFKFFKGKDNDGENIFEEVVVPVN
ncbi:hypothetical protein JL193_10270 [Polaribacter batillariae]|uniref:Lipoprotein n=1 Tax=Polaribacter batillariae TaxID=2808900 RepID=A0ABX7SQM2_9FLAO|nr:hypothetical protein [Polaribacter batillariae]QTD36532.1 hypothetical protein JL193_10270 [Polaribacter batillariae]